MATQPAKEKNLLYLDEITLNDVLNREYTLRLFLENEERELQTQDNRTWTPVQRPFVSPTSEMRAEIHMRSGHLFWATYRQESEEINLQGLLSDYWGSKKHEFTIPKVVVVGKHRWSLELKFSANTTAETLRLSLHELQNLLEEYSPLMTGSTERAVEKGIKYGAVFAELNPIAKAVFGVASVTFELLKEQNKYDQMPSGLFDRLQRILLFADKVIDDIVCEETELLDKIIPQMFEMMYRVAKFACNYVKCARTVGGMVYPETIEEVDRELTKAIEDFDRAVDVEALRLAKKSELVAEQDLLRRRLKPVETGYHRNLCCMEGTRQYLLNRIMAWVSNELEQKDTLQGNIYWLYGLPGIGKTSLAHSVCASLHERGQLAGAFFCRRDHATLSEPRNILPTLIYNLAEIFPLFQNIVAKHLRDDLSRNGFELSRGTFSTGYEGARSSGTRTSYSGNKIG